MTRTVVEKRGSRKMVARHVDGATSVNRRLCAFSQTGLIYGPTLKAIAAMITEPEVCSVLETTAPGHRLRPSQTRTLTVAFGKGRHKRLDTDRMVNWPKWVRDMLLHSRPHSPLHSVAKSTVAH